MTTQEKMDQNFRAELDRHRAAGWTIEEHELPNGERVIEYQPRVHSRGDGYLVLAIDPDPTADYENRTEIRPETALRLAREIERLCLPPPITLRSEVPLELAAHPESRRTHSLCPACWNTQNPDRPLDPERDGRGQPERCCRCGHAHLSGIYVRAEPSEMRCGGGA